MRLPGIAGGFAPWVLFLVMPHRGDDRSVLASALVGVVVAGTLTVWTRGRSGVKLLDVAAAVTFTAITVAVVFGGPGARDWLRTYSSAVVLLTLGAVILLSARTFPFSEQYAREALPPEYWGSPHLRAVNRRISTVCGSAAVAAAVSVAVGRHAGSDSDAAASYVELLLTWVIPLASALVAYRYTEHAVAAPPRGTPRG